MTTDVVPDPPGLPPGRPVELPGRGTTFVRRLDGPPGAPTVILLHGWTVNAALNWFASFEPLARHVNVVALDHRGHGRGIRTWRRFRLEDCADDVVALADVLGLDRIIPVGYSMGGPIAQLVWRRHPDRVDGMVLCATSRAFGTSGAGGRAMASMAGMASLIVRATPRRVQRSVGSRLLDARFDQSDLGRWARQQVIQNDTRMVLEAGQALAGFSSREWIGGVDLPVAVVLTEYDSVVPPHRQRRLAESIPGATIHPVAGDHGVCSTDPRTFVPGLLDACDSVVTRGPARRRQAG
ncbi:MAG: alpha/beta fold hydrolase [Acidimicrobiales bacterium]